jgi:hypothetical protein
VAEVAMAAAVAAGAVERQATGSLRRELMQSSIVSCLP